MKDPASAPRSAVEMLAHHESVLRIARELGMPTTSDELDTRDILLALVAQGRRIAELERRLSKIAP